MRIRLVFVLAGFLFFVVLGVVVLFFVIRGMIEAIESNSWPSVGGVVKTCELAVDSSEGTHYSAKIAYEYSVNDKPFVGNRIASGGDSSMFESSAREEMKRYPKGKNVKVYYSPDDPSVALLEPGVRFGDWIGVLLAPLMFLIPTIVFWKFTKQLRDKDYIQTYF